MKIVIESLIEGAKRAQGVVVVIDVFRAFTTDAYVINNGAEKIILVGTVEEARKLKKEYPDYVLIGERGGIKVDGFDYGNSPVEISSIDFTNKTVIQTTSSGTKGVVNVRGAEEILLGSFVCLQALVNYIKKIDPPLVTIVATGESGIIKTDEDELCAQAIKDLLVGNKIDFAKIKKYLRHYESSLQFFDKTKPEFPEGDFHLAMDVSRFDFVLKVHKENNLLHVVKES